MTPPKSLAAQIDAFIETDIDAALEIKYMAIDPATGEDFSGFYRQPEQLTFEEEADGDY